jgi:hypothetical protein
MFGKLGMVLVCATALAVISGAIVTAEAQTPATRQEHEQAAEKKMNELDKKMHDLSAETKKAGGSMQAEINKLYEDFKKQQGAAKGDLEELRKSTNETWEKAKKNMDKSLEDLNGLYERSKAKAKENSKDKAK